MQEEDKGNTYSTNKRTIIQYKNCQIPSDIRLCFSLGVLDTS